MTPPSIAADELADWVTTRAGATSSRFLLGITGAPGSGKSTLADRLAEQLQAVVVPMDGFHLANSELDQRGVRASKGAPHTFDADGFVDAVRAVRRADTDLLLPDFDREVDEPRPGRIRVAASDRLVVVEGNYLLLDSEPWVRLRDMFDAVAHIDIDIELRTRRLVERHVRFGKSRAEATRFVTESDEPNAVLVAAVSHRAHVIVESGR